MSHFYILKTYSNWRFYSDILLFKTIFECLYKLCPPNKKISDSELHVYWHAGFHSRMIKYFSWMAEMNILEFYRGEYEYSLCYKYIIWGIGI